MNGLLLALSWLTVLPLPSREVDARACRQAIALAPLVGALLGAFGAALLWALSALGAPGLLAGLLTVAAWALVTRGMHVDGLADTVDGLGCYGPPERALSVMRDGGAGPFAVVALIVVVGVQASALAELAASGQWVAVVTACAVGRAAFVFCCRRGLPAARPEGMGSLVAGTQPWWVVAAWWGVLLIGGAFALPGAWWLGPFSVLLAGGFLLVFTAHVRRRFGGVTGDVLGAATELTTTLVLAVSVLS
ncbi:adenosylcobinamide-GDP ribazoletransferase [Saccharopolyspora sp. NFXS83]|uniref:adenosylcobinamide-GDP ribazoletransferase n=1 Tax=Saccharopolyspora sp. NFXS83 TaxID=2993560 RepID=UPI00224A8320|nr:adenosylcobinamide-GDP ribazoletransferase [Saccharopolyspora sp. NFXS83]MCX2734346.1 adenosylcobinamide-GDP ribazoletransferase [Saccharopolyspora sp. NFXS83]